MLPIHASSIRTCATIFPPSSATAMFMGWPISLAFFSAALITRRASSNLTAVMSFPYAIRSLASGFRCSLFDQICDGFRMRKHWHVTRGNSDRRCFHCRGLGLFKLRRNSAIVAGNHAPRWLGLPRGGRNRGPKYSRCCRSLCRRQQLLLVVWQILGKVLGNSLWGHGQKTVSIRPDFAA